MRGAGRPVVSLSGNQRHLTSSAVREAAISSLIAVVVLIGVVWNLPESEIKRVLIPVLRPIASSAGLDQSWQMYAPDPFRRHEAIEIRVTMGDGSERTWVNPRGDRVIGSFDWYHWQKIKENLPREREMQAGVAHWVVRELTEPSEKPIRVRIVLSTETMPPPGANGPTTASVETIYDENLSGAT
jgi:hypothetical protein